MLTLDNTSGYTQQQLDALNSEFEARYLAGDWPDATRDDAEQRIQAEKWFADEVAGR